MARAAKKVPASATAKTRPGGKKGRTWNWKFKNTYVSDQKKWTKEARLTLPAPKDTVRGCIFAALVAVKKGTDKEIEDAAIKMGLGKLTTQSTKKQVQMKLRRFAKHGVVLREKNTKKMLRHELRAQRAAERLEAKQKKNAKTATARPPVPRPAPASRPAVPVPAVRPPRKAAPKAVKAVAPVPAPPVPPVPVSPNPAKPPRPRLRAKAPGPVAAPAPGPTPVPAGEPETPPPAPLPADASAVDLLLQERQPEESVP